MASKDSERQPQVREEDQEVVDRGMKLDNETSDRRNTKKNSKKRSSYVPKFGCFRIEYDASGESYDIEVVDASGRRPNPTHLVIMVNGLIGR